MAPESDVQRVKVKELPGITVPVGEGLERSHQLCILVLVLVFKAGLSAHRTEQESI